MFGQEDKISTYARHLITRALSKDSSILISIPSVVFLELYDKWINNEEFARKFYYNIFIPIINAENIEIRSIDREIITHMLELDGEQDFRSTANRWDARLA